MYRAFEELGVACGGVSYGFFTGEVQFDETGQPVIIDIEASGFDQNPLRLDIEGLVRERIALRRKHGVGFLEDAGYEVREHAKRWMLFQALGDSLVIRYKDDIEDYRAELQSPRGANAA